MYAINLNNVPVKVPYSNKEWYDSLPVERQIIMEQHLVHDDVHNWLDSLGMFVAYAEVFIMPPNYFMDIHRDGTMPSNSIKLVWAYSDEPHHTTWWEPKPEYVEGNLELDHHENAADDYALTWKPEQCKELHRHSAKSDQPTMINFGIPHSVTNGNAVRKSICLTPLAKNKRYPHRDWNIQWDESMELFGAHLL